MSQYSSLLAPIAVDAILHVVNPDHGETNVDLHNIRIVKKVGGTIDDSELSNGLILTQNVITSAGGPTRVEKAKIGLIQFQLSPPKSDVRECVRETPCAAAALARRGGGGADVCAGPHAHASMSRACARGWSRGMLRLVPARSSPRLS